MRKIFFAFAEEAPAEEPTEATVQETTETKDEPYVYTSEQFKYTITCPFKPIAAVHPAWFEDNQKGEMLVFANEGIKPLYAYVIHIDAFETDQVPDFNKGTVKRK